MTHTAPGKANQDVDISLRFGRPVASVEALVDTPAFSRPI
jgi:hypothetical protein